MTRQESAQAAQLPDTAPNVQNGTYTVDHPKQGHFTIKLHTAQQGSLAGKRILSLLTGPDNTSAYTGVAFWNDADKVAHVWRRHKGSGSRMRVDGYNWQPEGWSQIEQKLAIWCDLATRGWFDEDGVWIGAEPGCDDEGPKRSFWATHGYTLLREGRCVKCNHKLTAPESIATGIGPKCGGRS